MKWNALTDITQLDLIIEESKTMPVLILKHSTRCSISNMALNRLESNWQNEDSQHIKPYYLDLLNHRDISNAIAEQFGIEHQSPQVLIISGCECIYHESHSNIRYADIMKLVK
ncbi:MAG TPA: bacillithiol system redox-active protein YtxJ [Bacteroidia bacterium]|nr:bacillithiol system redox-active protein YtxJ [Bacteroidia bacterium]